MRIDGNTPVDALYHSDDELMHWKYVKREKKNGKWKYYYDWDELKKDTKAFVNDPTGSKRKEALNKAQKAYTDATNTIESRRMRSIDYRKAIADIKNAKQKGTKYVVKGFLAETAAIDLDKQSKAKKQLDEAKQAYKETIPAKIEKAKSDAKSTMEGAKQAVKDVLGYDEQTYKDYAYEMREKTRRDIDKANDEYFLNDPPSVATEEGYKSYMDHRTRVDEIEAKYEKWADEYVEAKEDYMKTPLGMLESVGDAIESGIWWVEDLFAKKRKK